MTTPLIAVVIPYFQREAGVLRRALASVAEQKDCPGLVEVIVVDDASPVPATGEVAAVEFPESIRVRVIRQPNGGPGAARNTGLEAVTSCTRWVAFLDSDDQWHEQHLVRAVMALKCGHDAIFGDHFQLGQDVGAFERAGRLQLHEHPLLPTALPGLHAFTGSMFDQILIGNVIGTSTVVYDRQRYPQLRFRTEFTHAGEDYLFWMELAQAGARFAFSTEIEATYGRGVNVYSGSGWGTDQFAVRLHNELKFRKTVRRLFPLTPEQDARIGQGIRSLRTSFASDILHRISHRKPLALPVVRAQWQLDPLTFMHLPIAVARRLTGRS